MKTFFFFLKVLSGGFLILLAFLIGCACELTRPQHSSDLDAPRLFAVILFVTGLILFTEKELKE